MARLRGVCGPAGVSAAGGLCPGEVARGQILRDHGVLLGSGVVWHDGSKEFRRSDGREIIARSV